MKYCKDCKFYRSAGGIWGITWPEACQHHGLKPWVPNLITGNIEYGNENPEIRRKDEFECGMDAKWFEELGKVMLNKLTIPSPYEMVEVAVENRPWWKLW